MKNRILVAVPAILAGLYYWNSSELREYGQSHFKANSVVCPYLRRDVPVFLNPGAGMLGYTNRLRDGRPKSCARPGKGDLADEAVYYLGFLAELMDALRGKGIYRRSLIVIAGDHGIETNEKGVNANGVPDRAFPFLMVKAVGRCGTLGRMRTDSSGLRWPPQRRNQSRSFRN